MCYCGGIPHHTDNYIMRCRKDGILVHEVYFNIDLNVHREDGPAVRRWDINRNLTDEMYYINGKCHSEHGPATRFWIDNKLLTEIYHINGGMHREDGPAYVRYGNIRQEMWFWSNGKPHTFGMMRTHVNKSFKRGVEVDFKHLVESGKTILRFMKNIKSIRRSYEKRIEKSIWWSFPGLGKILLELNGGL